MLKNPKVVSMFSGCGGMDLGFLQAGFDILFSNDFNPYACSVYRENIGEIYEGDIQKVSLSLIPSSDVFIAGFPCQPFSSAGKRLSDLDVRGNLYIECLKYIDIHNPYFVVFENVQGILSAKNQDGSSFIETVETLLRNTGYGYDVKLQLMKSEEYGVPQRRKRVIIVGVRKDLNIDYVFPEKKEETEQLTVQHIINLSPDIQQQGDVMPFSPQSKLLIPYIKEGGSWKDIPYDVLPERLKKIRDNMKKYHSPNFYRRFARHEINGTITATATPEKCGIIHPLADRRYSVREVARFQTFPDDFIFSGKSLSPKYRVIGNAVPPLLAYEIGMSIKRYFPL